MLPAGQGEDTRKSVFLLPPFPAFSFPPSHSPSTSSLFFLFSFLSAFTFATFFSFLFPHSFLLYFLTDRLYQTENSGPETQGLTAVLLTKDLTRVNQS